VTADAACIASIWRIWNSEIELIYCAGRNGAIGRPLALSIASGEKNGPLDRIGNIRGRRQI
jgi:hypothetical protein